MIKFCVISMQGSGTGLLETFLNSHPNIFIGDELFISKPDMGEFKNSGYTDKKKYLHNFYSRRQEEAVGFDLKYNQMDDDILDYLDKEDVAVIHLYRDLARTFLKVVEEDKHDNKFSYKDINEYCKRVNDFREKVEMKLSHDNKYIKLHYEDMTRGKEITELPKDFENILLGWLGVDRRPLYYAKANVAKRYGGRELKLRFK